MYKKAFKANFVSEGCRAGVIALLFLAISFPANVLSETVLSEGEAVRLGLERSDVTLQLQSLQKLAESDVVKAGILENPEFSYEQEHSNDDPDDITERSYMLSQTLDVFGKRTLKRSAATQRLHATKQEIAQWRLERSVELKQKFYMVLYQQELHDIFSIWRSGMDSMEVVMRKRLEAGDISGYDLERLMREQAFVQASQRQTHGDHELLLQELAALVGLSENKVKALRVTGSLLPETSLPPLETLLSQATKQPALLAIEQELKASALEEKLAARRWLPDITLGIGMKEVDEGEGDAVIFNMSIPLPVFDRGKADNQRAKATQVKLQSKYQIALTEKEGKIRGLWHQAGELTDASSPFVSDNACKVLVQKAEVAYREGEIGVLELLDAYRNSFENKSQILSLMLEARLARIQLDLLTGGNS